MPGNRSAAQALSSAAIVQARMGSERLPGKTLLALAGVPVLQHVLDRLASCNGLDLIAVATSRSAQDDPIEKLCETLGVPCIRGSETDVLGRYILAASKLAAQIVVRVPADNPLCHPPIVDDLVSAMRSSPSLEYCYVTDAPLGTACEAVTLAALKKTASLSSRPEHREHVTLFIREHPELFSVARITSGLGNPELRLTLDTPQDYQMLSAVFDALYTPDRLLDVADVIDYLNRHDNVRAINASVRQKRPGMPVI